MALLKLNQARSRAQEHAARIARDLDELALAQTAEREQLQLAEAERGRAAEMAGLQGERLEHALAAQRERGLELQGARSQEQALAREQPLVDAVMW